MQKSAELTILYDANSLPIAATCSACRESMSTAYPRTVPADIIAWFAAHFEIHKKHNHPTQESNSPDDDLQTVL